MCGCDSCVDFADFAGDREGLLREFPSLETGLPSHDAFSGVFRFPDPEAFAACLGRFVEALEMAVRARSRTGRMALMAPVGIKLSGREERDFADLPFMQEAEAALTLFHDPARWAPDHAALDEAAVEALALECQWAAWYGWKPYMHNPLLAKWLHRAAAPAPGRKRRLRRAGIRAPAGGPAAGRPVPDDPGRRPLSPYRTGRRDCRGGRGLSGERMMQVRHFSEMACRPGWEALHEGLRNVIPSRVYDPETGADLYRRYLDKWALCGRLGLNIMVNEHHATATCTTSLCTITMAIPARETRNARLLCLGMPIGNRMDAGRVAEEYAMLDVISRGARRDRVREGRALRDQPRQFQSGGAGGAFLGGARPDREGDDDP